MGRFRMTLAIPLLNIIKQFYCSQETQKIGSTHCVCIESKPGAPPLHASEMGAMCYKVISAPAWNKSTYVTYGTFAVTTSLIKSVILFEIDFRTFLDKNQS